MKKLIIFESILILFFVFAWNVSKAEVFNCKMTLTSDEWGTQYYELLVDTGNEIEDIFLTVVDREMNLDAYEGGFYYLSSIGKIYFQNGNPYGLAKDDRKVLFQFAGSYEYVGIILRNSQGPSTVFIKDENYSSSNPKWTITITDTDTSFDKVQKGVCN